MDPKDIGDNAFGKDDNISGDISGRKKRKGKSGLYALIALLLLIVGAVVLYQGCDRDVPEGVVKPEPLPLPLPDSDTVPQIVVVVPDTVPVPRPKPAPEPPVIENGEVYYTIAETGVTDGDDGGKALGTIPYGSEILRLEYDADNVARIKHGKIKGFVSADNILDEDDFRLFESMFTSRELLDAIPQAALRRALFDYYKKQGMAGKWQVAPSGILVKNIFGENSPCPDMAVVMEASGSGERRILILFRTDGRNGIKVVLDDKAFAAPYDISDVAADSYGLKIKYSKPDYDSMGNYCPQFKTVVYDEFHGRYMRR